VKTIARAVAVALLTAGAVAVPASAEAIAAPLHSPASAMSAAPLLGRDHNPTAYRHDGDLRHYRHGGDQWRYRHGGDQWRYRDNRGWWRHGSHRYRSCDRFSGWDRDCYRDWGHDRLSYDWDCYPYGRR
jgi:hypothetical protein